MHPASLAPLSLGKFRKQCFETIRYLNFYAWFESYSFEPGGAGQTVQLFGEILSRVLGRPFQIKKQFAEPDFGGGSILWILETIIITTRKVEQNVWFCLFA